mmetsp:Transcript_28698/g.66186  ORF Transcript_28698/g.66186 Transcript_28698/m.66186 type:complete len:209 (-) Transcript_28698:334-960(-)
MYRLVVSTFRPPFAATTSSTSPDAQKAAESTVFPFTGACRCMSTREYLCLAGRNPVTSTKRSVDVCLMLCTCSLTPYSCAAQAFRSVSDVPSSANKASMSPSSRTSNQEPLKLTVEAPLWSSAKLTGFFPFCPSSRSFTEQGGSYLPSTVRSTKVSQALSVPVAPVRHRRISTFASANRGRKARITSSLRLSGVVLSFNRPAAQQVGV